MLDQVDPEVALAAFRAYHGKAAKNVRVLSGGQLRVWEAVAAAAVDAWRDNRKIHENETRAEPMK
jgi:hypothetical protein